MDHHYQNPFVNAVLNGIDARNDRGRQGSYADALLRPSSPTSRNESVENWPLLPTRANHSLFPSEITPVIDSVLKRQSYSSFRNSPYSSR